jgi:hypothetical protein
MPYKCIHGGVTRPCIYDPRYDGSLSEEGRKTKKRVYRSARKGDEFPFVCPVSRKYFVATDEATRKQDERDLAEINAELKALGYDIPKDALVWESAATLSAHNHVERVKKERKPTRIFNRQAVPKGYAEAAPDLDGDDPVSKPVKQDAHKEVAIQKKELRDWIRANGGSCTNFDGLPKLKQIKKNIKRELDK